MFFRMVGEYGQRYVHVYPQSIRPGNKPRLAGRTLTLSQTSSGFYVSVV